MNKFIYLALLAALSCQKNQPVGPAVTITGSVLDTVRNTPVEGARVVVYETNCWGLCVDEKITILDSTISDANGQYKLEFHFSGQAGNYHIEIFQDPYVYFGQVDVFMRELQDTTINFQVFRKSILKHRIYSKNFQYQKLNVTTLSSSHMLSHYTPDTTLYFDIAPNHNNYLIYQNYNPPPTYKEHWDTVFFAGVKDTFERSINLDTVVFK